MKWLRFILSHSIFIAFCAVALAFQTALLLKLHNLVYDYGFIFFATLCSYNFYWVVSKITFAKSHSVGNLLRTEVVSLSIMLMSAVGLLYCFYQSSLHSGIVLSAILLTVFYVIPLLPFRYLQFTRKAGVLKTMLLAFTWAYVTVFIPLHKNYLQLNNADLFVFTRRFLFMLMLCIIFDNRDKAIDKIRGLHSLATVLKPQVLQILIYFIFATLFISNFLYRDYGISFRQSVALQVSTMALLAVYFYAAKKRGYFFYYFFVDGMMLFSALATSIASI
jgi:hypothetical protein